MKKFALALAALSLLATVIPASAGPTCVSSRLGNGSVVTTCY